LADAVIAELGLEEELPVGDVAAHGATTTPPGYWYDKDGTKADNEADGLNGRQMKLTAEWETDDETD
jgi:hypothetical protein